MVWKEVNKTRGPAKQTRLQTVVKMQTGARGRRCREREAVDVLIVRQAQPNRGTCLPFETVLAARCTVHTPTADAIKKVKVRAMARSVSSLNGCGWKWQKPGPGPF